MPILPHASGTDPAEAAHRLPQARRRPVRRRADGARGVHRHVVAALSHASADDGEVACGGCGRSKLEADPDQTLRHRHFRTVAGEAGRQPDARPHSAAVQPGHRDAVRRAGRERRALLPQRAGGRAGVRRQGHGHPRDRCSATCRSARATTSSSTAASCIAAARPVGASRPSCWSWRAAATCAGPSAIATSSASSSRARPTRERDIRRPRELQHARREGRLPASS